MRGIIAWLVVVILAGCGTTPSLAPSTIESSQPTPSATATAQPTQTPSASDTPSPSAVEVGAATESPTSEPPPATEPPKQSAAADAGVTIVEEPVVATGADPACSFPPGVGLAFAGETTLGALQLTDPSGPLGSEAGAVYVTAGPIELGATAGERAWCLVIDMDGEPYVEVGLVPATWTVPPELAP